MKIKKIIKHILILIVFFKIFTTYSIVFASNYLCDNKIIDYLIKKDYRNIEYNESRNDAGIHFSYSWDKKDKIIIFCDVFFHFFLVKFLEFGPVVILPR